MPNLFEFVFINSEILLKRSMSALDRANCLWMFYSGILHCYFSSFDNSVITLAVKAVAMSESTVLGMYDVRIKK